MYLCTIRFSICWIRMSVELLIMCFLWQTELTFCAGDIIAVFGDIDEDGFYYVSLIVVLTAHAALFWACSTIVFCFLSFRVSLMDIVAWFHPIFSKKCLMTWRSIWRTLPPTTVRTSPIWYRHHAQRPNGYTIAVLSARPCVHSSSVWVSVHSPSLCFLVLVCFFFMWPWWWFPVQPFLL